MDFQKALEMARGDSESPKIDILLGNGFSREYFRAYGLEDIFHYESLLDRFKQETIDEAQSKSIGEFFSRSASYDFEEAIHELNRAHELIEFFGTADNELPKKINFASHQIKIILLQAIAQSHPGVSSDISDMAYKVCSLFLSKFNKIFTLNYDLLLYWTHVKQMTDKFYDGFWSKLNDITSAWDESFGNENVFYLHGGMHIFDDDKVTRPVYKIICPKTGDYLLDQIKEKIKNDEFSLYVAEGEYPSKLEKIRKNIYLRYCYKKLSSSEGVMFTYGVSFDKDEHILMALKESKLKKLFVGIFDNNDKPFVKAENFLKEKLNFEVHKYDASTVNVWRNEDEKIPVSL